MRYFRHYPLLLITLYSSLLSTLAASGIALTNTKGITIHAEPLALKGDQLSIKMPNGKVMTFAITELNAASRETVTKYLDSNAPSSSTNGTDYEAANKAIGHPLFKNGTTLWETDIKDLAARLKWPLESSTNSSSSYRFYPPSDYGFLNAHPYSTTAYGDENGKVNYLSLVFANKGDYYSTVGRGEDHFKPRNDVQPKPNSLQTAMERDKKNITNVLTELLGEPVKQRYGERHSRTNSLRWDIDDQSFILTSQPGEYIRMLIVPSEVADNQGKEKFISDSVLKAKIAKNIETNDFGDTFLKDIPMVDQGPKGYCAPATFERAMRYMHVPADMYLLATIATLKGGGTNTELLADEAKSIIRSKARRIKSIDSESFKLRNIKRYIDKGVPILWTMRSLHEYNAIANKRLMLRAKQTDPATWKTDIEAEAEKIADSLENNNSNHHICLIIGYNEKTNEIAVSDSWGIEYSIRWVHIDLINGVTDPGSFVIDI